MIFLTFKWFHRGQPSPTVIITETAFSSTKLQNIYCDLQDKTPIYLEEFCCSKIRCWASQFAFSSSNWRRFSSNSLCCASKFFFICSWRRCSYRKKLWRELVSTENAATFGAAVTNIRNRKHKSYKPEWIYSLMRWIIIIIEANCQHCQSSVRSLSCESMGQTDNHTCCMWEWGQASGKVIPSLCCNMF